MKSATKKSVAPVKVPTPKPVVHAWRNRLPQPWTTFCDARAVVAVISQLHQREGRPWFKLEELVAFVLEDDLGCLPYLRRADILEAFNDRNDVAAAMTLLVKFLVDDEVLISEVETDDEVLISEVETDGVVYRINWEEVYALDSFHAAIDRSQAKMHKLHVVP